jgi:hypothetical protein
MQFTSEAVVAAVAIVISLMGAVYTALRQRGDKAAEKVHDEEVAKIVKLEIRLDIHEARIQKNELAAARLEADQHGLAAAVAKLERSVEERMQRVEDRLDAILLELQRKKG